MSIHGDDVNYLLCVGLALIQVLPVLPEDAELVWAADALVTEADKYHPDLAVLRCAWDSAECCLSQMAELCTNGYLPYILLNLFKRPFPAEQ